jgi:SPP1 gp7 family putative phage head morphogenesis protein
VYALADDVERERAVGLVGKPTDLAATAISHEVGRWAKWQAEVATVVAAASSAEDAEKRLAQWAERAADDEDIVGGVYRATLQSDLAGQLFVRVVEVPESLPTRALDNRPRPSFLSLPFEEAIESFRERRLVSPEEFRQLSDEAKQRAFTATRLAADQVRQRAQREVLRALEEGTTLDEFAAQLRTAEVSLGVTPSDPAYVETVFRTNVASSYGAGRYRQLRSPAVVKMRPFVQYRNAGDARVTDICRELGGKVFRQDDPSWQRFAPPNHFNCRSVIVSLPDPRGNAVSTGADIQSQPATGFDTAPSVELTGTGQDAPLPEPIEAPPPEATPEPETAPAPAPEQTPAPQPAAPTPAVRGVQVTETDVVVDGVRRAVTPQQRAEIEQHLAAPPEQQTLQAFAQQLGDALSDEQRAVVRSFVRSYVSSLVSRDVLLQRPARGTLRPADTGVGGVYNPQDGSISIDQSYWPYLTSALDKLQRGERLTLGGEFGAIVTLLHEEVHGMSPGHDFDRHYRREGAATEEVSTEATARAIARRSGLATGISSTDLSESYDEWILPLQSLLVDHGSDDGAEALSNASIRYRSPVEGRVLTDYRETTSAFLDELEREVPEDRRASFRAQALAVLQTQRPRPAQ